MPNPSNLEREQSGMSAIEAIRYCLGEISDTPEDGEIRSRAAWDRLGNPHWMAWRCSPVDEGENFVTPRFCSESPYAFIKALEPYTAERKVQR